MLIEKNMSTSILDSLEYLWTLIKMDLYKIFAIIDDDIQEVVLEDSVSV